MRTVITSEHHDESLVRRTTDRNHGREVILEVFDQGEITSRTVTVRERVRGTLAGVRVTQTHQRFRGGVVVTETSTVSTELRLSGNRAPKARKGGGFSNRR